MWEGSSQLSTGTISQTLSFTCRFCLRMCPYQDSGWVSQIQKDKTKDKLLLRSGSLHAAPKDWCIMAGEAMTTASQEHLQGLSQSHPSPLWHRLVSSFRFKGYFDLWRTAGESLWLLQGFRNLNYPHLKNNLCFKHRGASGYASEMPAWEQFIAQCG